MTARSLKALQSQGVLISLFVVLVSVFVSNRPNKIISKLSLALFSGNERCRPSYSVTLWDERQIIAFPEEAISKSALRKDPFGYLLEPFYVHS